MDAVRDARWALVQEVCDVSSGGPPDTPLERFHELLDALETAIRDDERVGASLDRENLNSQLTDWRERALRCEKLRRDIVPMSKRL